MQKLFQAILFLLFLGIGQGPAQASSDYGCTPTIKVFRSNFTGCEGMGFLAPANDTRINLIYLMADAQKQKLMMYPNADNYFPLPRDFSPGDWQNFSFQLTQHNQNSDQSTLGEGTICVSFDSGATQFINTVMKAGLLPVLWTAP